MSMLDMKTLGKMSNIKSQFYFEWEIEDFFSLCRKFKSYKSPSFSFAGSSWHLEIDPYVSDENSIEYVSLYICRQKPDAPCSLTWSFSLRTVNLENHHEAQASDIFSREHPEHGWDHFVKRSTLLEKKSELVPSDVLTIIFTAHNFTEETVADQPVVWSCFYCKNGFDVKYLPSHEEICLDRPIPCPTCKKATAMRNWPEHECVMTTMKEDELMNDFVKLLRSKELSDVTIKVKDEEFRLHRSILAARNPYFHSMFKAEMKETRTGIVTIEDCEPDIFRSFVYFVYTGKLLILSCDNVCGLYKVAELYQQDQLKVKCLNFMKTAMPVDSFCDFVMLALTHDEKELLQSATDLFCRKTKQIIQTVKWQTFMLKYPTEANELIIKAIDYNAK